ncbi:SufE family protein [Oligoflexaceae bacterium]|nr:SufE family protein [Oligoflexaceae bacterium]
MNITQKKEKILAELSEIADKDKRFEFIISLGKKHPALEESKREDRFLVKGCMSQAWLVPNLGPDGRLHFEFDSEAIIVKGIMALLMSVYNDNKPEDNLHVPPEFLADVGVTEHLSMNRRSGLANLLKQIHMYSATFKALADR